LLFARQQCAALVALARYALLGDHARSCGLYATYRCFMDRIFIANGPLLKMLCKPRFLSQASPLDIENPIVYIVDDDELMRTSLSSLLRSIGLRVQTFESTGGVLDEHRDEVPSCLILDVRLRGESGLEFQRLIATRNELRIPIIFMTAHGDIEMSVEAMKAGALDFLAKPFRNQDMIDAVTSALKRDTKRLQADRAMLKLRACYQSLTPREREVAGLVIAGLMNKQIARKIGIAEITAKIHRGHAMKKMESSSMADFVRKMEALGVTAADGAVKSSESPNSRDLPDSPGEILR